MTKLTPQELFPLYTKKRESSKKYMVNNETIGKVKDLNTKQVAKIKVSKGTILRKLKTVDKKPKTIMMINDKYPNLRFYILRSKLDWINKNEVDKIVKEYMKELKSIK